MHFVMNSKFIMEIPSVTSLDSEIEKVSSDERDKMLFTMCKGMDKKLASFHNYLKKCRQIKSRHQIQLTSP